MADHIPTAQALYEAREEQRKLKEERDHLRQLIRSQTPELSDRLDSVEAALTEANKREVQAKENFAQVVLSLARSQIDPLANPYPFTKIIHDPIVIVPHLPSAVQWLFDHQLHHNCVNLKFSADDRAFIRSFQRRNLLPQYGSQPSLYVDDENIKVTVYSHDRWSDTFPEDS